MKDKNADYHLFPVIQQSFLIFLSFKCFYKLSFGDEYKAISTTKTGLHQPPKHALSIAT